MATKGKGKASKAAAHAQELQRLMAEQQLAMRGIERDRVFDRSVPLNPERRAEVAAPGRRDSWYLPAGYSLDPDGFLVRVAAEKVALSQHEIDTALSLSHTLLAMVRRGAAEAHQLPAIAKAFEEILGYPKGQRWRATLEGALWQDIYNRENLRRTGKGVLTGASDNPFREPWEAGDRSLPLPDWREVTDLELLEWVRHRDATPPELTVAVIHEFRARASLAGGGGRGARVKQSPRRLIEAFGNRDKLKAKKARKKQKKRRSS